MKRRTQGDQGAMLVIALIIITVVALGAGVVLTLGDSNLKSTSQLRNVSARVYDADGAAKVALNNLRKSSYVDPSQPCPSVDLPNFFSKPVAGSAYVTCAPDPGSGIGGGPVNGYNTPRNALITLATTGNGLDVTLQGNSGDFKITGSVYSNSGIAVDNNGGITASGNLVAEGACTGVITALTKKCSSPHQGSGEDPQFSPPTVPAGNPTPPACVNGQPSIFQPGTYANAAAFQTAAACDKATVIWFQKGVYKFQNLGTISFGSKVVGGGTSVPTGSIPIPGSCTSPIPNPNPPASGLGVEFVFAGNTEFDTDGDQIELCGSYSQTSPPIVIYGDATSTGTIWSSDNKKNTNVAVWGMIYAPKATIDLSTNNGSIYRFKDAIVVNRFLFDGNPNPSPIDPVVSTNGGAPGPGPNVAVYLTVYVCPTPTCSASGQVALQVRAAIIDPTGNVIVGRRQINILSWANKVNGS